MLGATSVADITTTYLGSQLLGSRFQELNPLAKHLIDNFGILGTAIGLKTAAVISAIGIGEVTHRFEERTSDGISDGFLASHIGFGIISLITSAAVVNNLLVINHFLVNAR